MELSGGKWILSGSQLLVGWGHPLQGFLGASVLCEWETEFPGSFLQQCHQNPWKGGGFQGASADLCAELTLQCWDTTAEGPRGPACGGSVKS